MRPLFSIASAPHYTIRSDDADADAADGGGDDDVDANATRWMCCNAIFHNLHDSVVSLLYYERMHITRTILKQSHVHSGRYIICCMHPCSVTPIMFVDNIINLYN